MKRFTLILSLLVAMVTTAMAQVTSLDQITDDKVFTIESERAFLMYDADINASSIITTTGKTTPASLKIKNSASPNQQFQIKTVDGNRYLYSVAAGKYLAEGNNLTETPSHALTISETNNETYKWYLQVGNHGLNSQEGGQTDEGIMVNDWTTVDGGNRYRIIDVEDVADLTAVTLGGLSGFNMGRAYTATTPNRGAWTVKDDLSAFASTTDANQSVDASNVNQQFAVISADGTDYYLYSVAAKKFVNHDKTLTEYAKEPIEITSGTGNYSGRLRVNFKGISNTYINHGGSHQMTIDSWGTIDDGNAIKFLEVSTFDPAEALSRIINIEADYRLIDNAGNVYEGTFIFKGYNAPEIAGAFGATFINGAYDEDKNLYTATIDFAYPMSKVGGDTNETLLYIKNGDEHKYIRSVGDDVKVQVTSVADVDANCLWAIYPTFSEGAIKFAIMNIATGKYIKTAGENAVHDTKDAEGVYNNNAKGAVVLNAEPTMFIIGGDNAFKSTSNNLFLSINSPRDDQDVFLGLHGSTHSGTTINDSTLPQYNVAIGNAKYATFYAPVAVIVPENVVAYAVTINDGGWADLTEIGTTIPAYTGVVLFSETPETYTFTVTENTDAIEDNELLGTVAATYITAEAYVLGMVDGEVGFYKATTNGQEEGTFLNNHHKAYLPKTAGMNAASYSFRFGEGTTGVENVVVENEVKAIYDLTGRRVENISAPGIYIVNGVKKLVR